VLFNPNEHRTNIQGNVEFLFARRKPGCYDGHRDHRRNATGSDRENGSERGEQSRGEESHPGAAAETKCHRDI